MNDGLLFKISETLSPKEQWKRKNGIKTLHLANTSGNWSAFLTPEPVTEEEWDTHENAGKVVYSPTEEGALLDLATKNGIRFYR